MGRITVGILGGIAGGLLGILAGLVFVSAWFALGLPAWGSDPKSLDMLMTCCAVGMVAGIALGGWGFARIGARHPGRWWIPVALATIAIAVLAALLGVGL